MLHVLKEPGVGQGHGQLVGQVAGLQQLFLGKRPVTGIAQGYKAGQPVFQKYRQELKGIQAFFDKGGQVGRGCFRSVA